METRSASHRDSNGCRPGCVAKANNGSRLVGLAGVGRDRLLKGRRSDCSLRKKEEKKKKIKYKIPCCLLVSRMAEAAGGFRRSSLVRQKNKEKKAGAISNKSRQSTTTRYKVTSVASLATEAIEVPPWFCRWPWASVGQNKQDTRF